MDLSQPTPTDVRAAREAAMLTQPQAADVVHLRSRVTWALYESGRIRMPMATWEFFLLSVGQHPHYYLASRRREV